MSSVSSIKVEVSADGSSAVLPLLPPETAGGVPTDIDLVLAALREDNVISHIDHDTIIATISRARETGIPACNVVAASARLEHSFKFFGQNGQLNTTVLAGEINDAREVYQLLAGNELDSQVKAHWIEPGVLLYEVFYADTENVLGERITRRPLPFSVNAGKNIVNDQKSGGFRYISDASGFLAIDENNTMHLVSPFVISEDRMTLYLRLVALNDRSKAGLVQAEINRLYAGLVLSQCQEMTVDEINEQIADFYAGSDNFLELVVARGREVVPGEPGRIDYLVSLHGKPLDIDANRIDYGDYTRYCMVQRGQGLAEIIRPVQGEPGIDVVGNIIECELLEEPVLNVAECVDIDESAGRKLLKSTMDGCVFFEKNTVRVTDTVVVSGNVGPESGSIKKGARSVIIKGNVLSGYSVESDDSVVIEGSVENGGKVTCKRLVVNKGVFGRKSYVYVTGNAQIGYVHGAVVRVLGDLTVLRYIMESDITCRGRLEVLGQGVNGKERGAVIGGNVSVLGSANLHSVGSCSEPTKVSCGIDQYLYNKSLVCRNIISGINTEVIRLQRSVGFDFSDPDVAERLRKMPPAQKELIARKLAGIKKLLVQIEQYQQQCQKVEAKALARNMDKLRLRVERHVIPLTSLAIGLFQTDVTSKLSGVSVRLKNGKVEIESI